MNSTTIFTKTAKGLMEIKNKTNNLSSDSRRVLILVDGKSSVAELQKKLDKLNEAQLEQALTQLVDGGFVREFVVGGASPAVTAPTPAPQNELFDLDFTSFGDSKSAPKVDLAAKARQDEQARKAAELANRAQAEAEARALALTRAKAQAEARQKQEQEQKARELGEAKAKAEAEARAKAEAEARARAATELKAKQEALARAKAEAEARIRAEHEARARAAVELKAKQEALARAKAEAEQRARREEEERKRREEEERKRREEEERARREAEERARREEEERKRREEEERKRREEEERARREAEERARREEEERKRREEEERARREAEERVRAEARAREAAQERARAAAEASAKAEAEERERKEAEAAEQERRKQEERERKEEEARRRAEEKKQKKIDAESEREAEKIRKSLAKRGATGGGRGAGKKVGAGVVALALAGVGALHVVPFSGLKKEFEQAAGKLVGTTVSVKSANVALFPTPHVKLADIKLGEAVQIGEAKLATGIGTLFGGALSATSAEFDKVVVTPDALLALFQNSAASSLPENLCLSSVHFSNVNLASSELPLLAESVTAEFNSTGTLSKIVASAPEKTFEIEGTPREGAMQISFSASGWTPPIGPKIVIEQMRGEGTVNGNELTVTQAQGTFYRGFVSGRLRVAWTGGWAAAGDLSAKDVDLAAALAGFGSKGEASGSASVNAAFTGQGPNLSGMLAEPKLEANFSVNNGSVGKIDLSNAMQAPAGASNLRGGQTRFTQLSGAVAAAQNTWQFKQLKLVAGVLNATGSGEIFPDNRVAGRVAVSFGTGARRNFGVSGTLDDPVVTK
jgi:hypothetical protein